MSETINKHTDWFRVLYTSLFYAGIILLSFGLFVRLERPTGLLITAYTILGLTIGMLATKMYLAMDERLRSITEVGIRTFLYNFLAYLGPVAFILVTISVTMYFLIAYRNNIDLGRVSNQYYTFSRISLFLMIVQFIILFAGFETKKFKDKTRFPSIYSSGIYLAGSINLFALLISGYILSSYTTDGFM
jgi:hypothetical protein